MKQYTYRVLLNRKPEGGYTVSVPSLPGCITYGEPLEKPWLDHKAIKNGSPLTLQMGNAPIINGAMRKINLSANLKFIR